MMFPAMALGLGALGSVLSPADLYSLALNAGFPSDTAVKMVAIALKESGGNPMSHYTGKTGTEEDSYGLYQINMLGALGAQRRQQFGISANTDLYNPSTNTRAAFAIWAGNDRNLDTAWYIDRDPLNRARYESFLPVAMAAAGFNPSVPGDSQLAAQPADWFPGVPNSVVFLIGAAAFAAIAALV